MPGEDKVCPHEQIFDEPQFFTSYRFPAEPLMWTAHVSEYKPQVRVARENAGCPVQCEFLRKNNCCVEYTFAKKIICCLLKIHI